MIAGHFAVVAAIVLICGIDKKDTPDGSTAPKVTVVVPKAKSKVSSEKFHISGSVSIEDGNWLPGVMTATIARDKRGRDVLLSTKVELNKTSSNKYEFNYKNSKIKWKKGKHIYYINIIIYENIIASEERYPRSANLERIEFEVNSTK